MYVYILAAFPNGLAKPKKKKRIHTTASEVAKRTIQMLQIDSTVHISEYIRYKSRQLCILSLSTSRTLIKMPGRQRPRQRSDDTSAP